MKYRITARTHQGLVRDHNEDNFILNPDKRFDNWYFDASRLYDIKESVALWVVADGMGGANAGEVASELAVMHMKKAFSGFDSKKTDPSDFLKNAVEEANKKIYEAAQSDTGKSGMGTTLVAALALGDQLHIAWVGDSRAYLFRNGTLRPITKDHSFVQQLVDAGKITPEEAFYHPQGNIILQSLGGEPGKVKPDLTSLQMKAGDRVLLCTDGLHGMLQDAVIQDILTHYSDFEDAANQLIEATLTEGAHDNVTLILAEIVQVPVGTSFDKPADIRRNSLRTIKSEQETDHAQPTETKENNRLPILMLFGILVLVFAAGILVPWKTIFSTTTDSDSTRTDSAQVVNPTDTTHANSPIEPIKPKPSDPNTQSPPTSNNQKKPPQSSSEPIPVVRQTPLPTTIPVQDTPVNVKPISPPSEKDTLSKKPIDLQKKPPQEDSTATFEKKTKL
ncbi:Stp1/IreP family PP2C-type Ser/Thr phosphatase [Thermaurantimonas aggregans]|uniref:Stp1/IreP family PP2C-type Ser/Thr phosphatase n=1 Tax=Thermaurantimonas aggregans TaxID=2173829 RepID=UPI0023F27419|nr:Stp1/IreP family PP2C-type Ser/Thr phosphatase [Thermaurantimonas aggregans]MCX8148079.1 Stp1/IreP family PP2C-type Ser/Thr phosphatase [Thermaurantimonas aggregans]